MKARDLIEELQKRDPDEEIYLTDSEYGCEPIVALERGMAWIRRTQFEVWTIR